MNAESSTRSVASSFGEQSREQSFVEKLQESAADRDVSPARVQFARELAKLEGGLDDDTREAVVLLTLGSLVYRDLGSSYIPVDFKDDGFLARTFDQLFDPDESNQITGFLDSLRDYLADPDDRELLATPGGQAPFVVDGDALYHHRIFEAEREVAGSMRNRLQKLTEVEPNPEVRRALADVRANPTFDGDTELTLDIWQQYALLTAGHCPVCLISGGPGTGKTTLITSVLRLFARLGVEPGEIALATPTGKAADRIQQAVYTQLDSLGEETSPEDLALLDDLREPKTLHRLLEYSPSRREFARGKNNPLEAELVVIDEASMLDLALARQLFAATPDDATLVLIGDADQLPAVNAGSVFQELIGDELQTKTPWRQFIDGDLDAIESDEPTAACSVQLQTNYRIDRDDPETKQLFEVIRRVRDGDASVFDPGTDAIPTRRTPEALENRGVEYFRPEGDRTGRREFVRWWYHRHINPKNSLVERVSGTFDLESDRENLDELFEQISSRRIITPTNVYASGTDAVNEMCRSLLARDLNFADATRFVPGEPVVVHRNDYSRGLFNGDQGVVARIKRDDDRSDEDDKRTSLCAIFRKKDGYTAFELSGLTDTIDPAFALTVHKAQGSEFDHTGFLIPPEPMPLLTRELIYTALTRARRSVTLVGDIAVLGEALRRESSQFSRLAERLGG